MQGITGKAKNCTLSGFLMILISCLLPGLCINASGQKHDYIKLADSLKTKDKASHVAALAYISAYEIEINTATQRLKVRNKNHVRYLSMKDNLNYSQHVITNSDVFLKNIRIIDKEGSSLQPNLHKKSFMQDYQFYDDNILNSYEIFVPNYGDIFSANYEVVYENYNLVSKDFFNEPFPVLYKEIQVKVPDWCNVEILEFNFEGYAIEKTVSHDPKNKCTRYTYKARNLLKFSEEKNTLGESDTYPHLLFLYKDYAYKGRQYNHFSSMYDLYNWSNELCKTSQTDKEKIKKYTAEVLQGVAGDDAGIRAIYYWVRDHIRYIAIHGELRGHQPEPAHTVYENKYGDCKGMSNLLYAMLVEAGYDARMSWVGTNAIPYNLTVPSLAIFDHMICTVYQGDKKIFLDATRKTFEMGEIDESLQGKQIMVAAGDSFVIDTLPKYRHTQNAKIYRQSSVIDVDKLKSEVSITLKGESKSVYYYLANEAGNENLQRLKNFYATMNLKDVMVAQQSVSIQNRDSLRLDFVVLNKKAVSKINKDLLVELDYLENYKDEMIDTNRHHHYYFEQKTNDIYALDLQIPQGYKVKKMPRGLHFESYGFKVDLSYRTIGNKIVAHKEISVYNAVIEKPEFKKWNEAIRALNSSYKDILVLTAAQ